MHAICDAKFTSRTSVYRAPFKGFRIHSYGTHADFVRRRFKLHRYYISPSHPMLAMFGIVHLQAKQSRLLIIVPLTASLDATRVER